MRAGDRILMLFDNTNRDYVSRLHSGASRQAGTMGVKIQMENLHNTYVKRMIWENLKTLVYTNENDRHSYEPHTKMIITCH